MSKRKKKEKFDAGDLLLLDGEGGRASPGGTAGIISVILLLLLLAAVAAFALFYNATDEDITLLTGQPYAIEGFIVKQEGMQKNGVTLLREQAGTGTATVIDGFHMTRYTFSIYDLPELEETIYDSQIGQTIEFPDADGFPFSYTSSDPSGLAIDGSTATVKKAGTYTVTRLVNEYHEDTITVNVEEPEIKTKKLKLYPGEKTTISVENIDASLIKWKSSDSRIVKVKNKKIKAKNPGRAELTAEIGGKVYSVTVKVAKKMSVDAIADLKLGETEKLDVHHAIGTPTYASSDQKVISVDKKGNITAKYPGSSTITVSLRNQKRSFAVVVTKPYFEDDSAVVTEDKTYENTIKNYDGSVTYTCSNNSIATVSYNGAVTGQSAGRCTITARTEEGYEISYDLKVREAPKPATTEEQDATVTVTGTSGSIDDFLNVCANIANYVCDNGWIYSNSGVGSTYSASKSTKKTNCAHYVSLCMQEAGLIPQGMAFWSDTSGNMRWDDDEEAAVKAVASVTHYENGIKVKDAGLQPGDILGYKMHMNVYAGKNSDGVRIWYDFGRDGTQSHSSGSKFNRSLCTRDYGNTKIYTLIRING